MTEQRRMTPADLRAVIDSAGITQQRAADLAGVKLRTMQQYLAGDRAMPLSASGLLCSSLLILGAPADLLLPWMPPAVAGERRAAGNDSN
jgi:transcriptional regulator with XRE-family HTH domain